LRKRPDAVADMQPLVVDASIMTASEIFVDQPIGKTGILYDCDMLSMHNSGVEVTVSKHIVQTTMLGLQHTGMQ